MDADLEPSRTILVVEDDPHLRSLVVAYLERDCFHVVTAADGPAGLEAAHRRQPDLVVLDLMLPGIDGLEVCRRLRRESAVPILMLTARVEEEDRVLGLTIGADDYVTKPFSPRELVARVKALLRRAAIPRPASDDASGRFTVGELMLDTRRHEVTVRGSAVDLTPSQFTLLHALIRWPGRFFDREDLLRHLYPNDERLVVSRTIDVHINKLREKIERDTKHPEYIQTVHGWGYKLDYRPNRDPHQAATTG